jgi:toxin ParE1/3/4
VKPVRFHREAEREIDEAAAYYEERREGLAREFISEVGYATAFIQEFPSAGALYKKTQFRFHVLRRFPYVLYYMELPDRIWVAAVAHGKRRPGYWKKRKPEVDDA